MSAPIFPNPIFEGSEKRIEVDFSIKSGFGSEGLRGFTRSHLDELMTLARCEIVSSRSNDFFDAYVLSESSLFVYPAKWVLKTCGTTKLLNSVPRLLELAAEHGLATERVKYTRASYLNPGQQEFPHTAFDHEVDFLKEHFGSLGDGGKHYVLGDETSGLQWHVYMAAAGEAKTRPVYNMEICMTHLCRDAAQQFYRTEHFVSAEHTTRETGILHVKPGAIIDDYVFEPCGYSMNGILDTGLMTIHITPEDGFSYASLEVSGHKEDLVDPHELLAKAVKIFNPGSITMTLTRDQFDSTASTWGAMKVCPDGYSFVGAAVQETLHGGRVCFYNLNSDSASKIAPSSPVTVLENAVSLGGSESDTEPYEILQALS